MLLCLDKIIGDVTPSGEDFHLGGNAAANIIRTAFRSPDPAVQQHAELIREGLLVMRTLGILGRRCMNFRVASMSWTVTESVPDYGPRNEHSE